jgi:DNA-binding NarL/FixJ family response regulator
MVMTRKNPETPSGKAKVLIVDDHPVVREGLAIHLATQPDLDLDAVRAILQSRVYVSGELATRLLQRVVGRKPEEPLSIDSLSNRELEAFQLLGEGMTTESIAEKMHVSPKTVETFRARIKEKLGISSLTELIQRAAQWVVESKYQRD